MAITGNDKDNNLAGGNGEDTIIGKGGDDTLAGDNANDRLVGGKGSDLLDGGNGDDLLLGGKGSDDLVGGNGEDTLQGGRGGDDLTGGSGSDVFRYTKVRHSTNENRDTIDDFGDGDADIIDLSDIDANQNKDGNQDFTFIGSDSFSGKAGELRFANGVLRGDVDGDGNADFAIELAGVDSIDETDLIL